MRKRVVRGSVMRYCVVRVRVLGRGVVKESDCVRVC